MMPEGRHLLHESKDTCDQEHWAQPDTAVDGVPTTTTAVIWTKTWLLSYIRVLHQSDQKKFVFWFIILKNTSAYSFMCTEIHWVCCIDMYRSDKISVHRGAPVNRYTSTWLYFPHSWHLWWESTGHQWILLTKASNTALWWFLFR